MKKTIIPLIAAAVLCAAPVHADEIDDKITAIEAQISELRQELIQLKAEKIGEDMISMVTSDGCTYQITKTEKCNGYDGTPCLLVYYTFDNNSDAIKDSSQFYIKAFQDGINIELCYIDENEAYENRYKEIMPGYSIECAAAFGLTSDNDVTLVVDDLYSFTENQNLMQIVKLQ